MKDEGDYIEFPIPEGMDLEGMEDGEEREVVAVIRKKEGNTACLISVYGIPIKKEEEESPDQPDVSPDDSMSEETPVDGYKQYADRAKQTLA